jgi:hypothetical protein
MKKSLFAIAILIDGLACAQHTGYSQSISPAMKALLEQRAKSSITKVKPTPTKIPIKLSAKMRRGIENDLKVGLKDPESARFGTMNALDHKNGEIEICGWVNAKNGYGGYTGETPFIAIYSIKTGHAVLGPMSEFKIIEPICLDDGLSLHPGPMSSFPKK